MLGLGLVRTCWLCIVQVIQAVDGHAQLARSCQCCVVTRLLEWYGMFKWKEKSSPMETSQLIEKKYDALTKDVSAIITSNVNDYAADNLIGVLKVMYTIMYC